MDIGEAFFSSERIPGEAQFVSPGKRLTSLVGRIQAEPANQALFIRA
jgi:hypothetical protein